MNPRSVIADLLVRKHHHLAARSFEILDALATDRLVASPAPSTKSLLTLARHRT